MSNVDPAVRGFCTFVALLTCILAVSPNASAQDVDAIRAELGRAADALDKGQPAVALEALAKVERDEPDNPWLSYYRGVAYFQSGDWFPAMEKFDRARDLLAAYGDPDPKLAETIRRYRRKARAQVFNVSFRFGTVYDGNVTFLGNGGQTFDTISGRGDYRSMARFGLSYSPIANDQEALTFAVRVSGSWHASIESFDDQDYGTSIRYARRINERWSAALQYDYDISYLGLQPFLSSHALSPSVTYSWRDRDTRLRPSETTVAYRIEARDFLFDVSPRLDRDGFANVLGIEQRFKFTPSVDDDWTWDLKTGYSIGSDATEGSEFDQIIHAFTLGLGMPLTNPWLPDKPLSVSLGATVQRGNYRNGSVFDRDRDKRDDVITTLEMVLSQQMVDDPDAGELVLNTIVSWSDADSNVTTRDRAQPFTYEKWVVGVQLAWSL